MSNSNISHTVIGVALSHLFYIIPVHLLHLDDMTHRQTDLISICSPLHKRVGEIKSFHLKNIHDIIISPSPLSGNLSMEVKCLSFNFSVDFSFKDVVVDVTFNGELHTLKT